jgi:hypothetical protein
MRKSLHSVFLSCLKASQLVEKQQIFGLSASELIQMKAHLLICKGCNEYKIQSFFIAKGIKEKIEKGETYIQISSEELDRVKKLILSKLS